MRLFSVLFIIVALACTAHAGERFSKSKGKGAWAFAVAKSQACPCGDSCPCGTQGSAESCASGQCATKPMPQAVPEAPVQSGTVIYSSGSCANGSCGGSQSYSRGLFSRRR